MSSLSLSRLHYSLFPIRSKVIQNRPISSFSNLIMRWFQCDNKVSIFPSRIVLRCELPPIHHGKYTKYVRAIPSREERDWEFGRGTWLKSNEFLAWHTHETWSHTHETKAMSEWIMSLNMKWERKKNVGLVENIGQTDAAGLCVVAHEEWVITYAHSRMSR